MVCADAMNLTRGQATHGAPSRNPQLGLPLWNVGLEVIDKKGWQLSVAARQLSVDSFSKIPMNGVPGRLSRLNGKPTTCPEHVDRAVALSRAGDSQVIASTDGKFPDGGLGSQARHIHGNPVIGSVPGVARLSYY